MRLPALLAGLAIALATVGAHAETTAATTDTLSAETGADASAGSEAESRRPLPLRVSRATVASGRMMIEGRTQKPRSRVRILGTKFHTISDDKGRFAFNLGWLPPKCKVTLRSRTAVADTLISECGPKGTPGERGAAGKQGPAGAQGPAGEPGPTGETGAKGAAGAQGPAGATGAQGPTGATGPQGAIGATGPQGPQGVQGPQGTPGNVVLTANIAADGSLNGGIGAIAATNPSTGNYQVQFNRNITACFYGGVEITLLPGAMSIAPETGDPTVIDVVTHNVLGNPRDVPFHLLVICD